MFLLEESQHFRIHINVISCLIYEAKMQRDGGLRILELLDLELKEQ